MVSTMPMRQILSTAERMGASKKNIDTKKNIGHSNSVDTINQANVFCGIVGCSPNINLNILIQKIGIHLPVHSFFAIILAMDIDD